MRIRSGLFLFIIIAVVACQSNPVPKPRGYFRIDLPEKKYEDLVEDYPFNFKYPDYGQIQKYEGIRDQGENADNWLNIDFPLFNARLHLTYKPVEENLRELIDDSHSFVYKHVSMADAINQFEFISPETSVYGLLFDIKGNTASALQFYVTDSISKFLRGALYFDCEPNRDSLDPVVEFFRKDIEMIMESFNWI